MVRRRRMVRSFTDEPLDPAQVDRLLGNAVRGPSAGFTQGWSFLVLETPADRELFWAVASPASSDRDLTAWKAGLRRAPLIVVPMASKAAYLDRYAEPDKAGAHLGHDESRWPVPYWHVDVGMASLLILQTAVDLSLGACFFGLGGPQRPAFHAAFGVPDAWDPTGVIAVGHPDEPGRGAAGSPARRPRKPLAEVVHRGRWTGQ